MEKFNVFDFVTRDGSDIHLVIDVDNDGFTGSFLCVKAPEEKWAKVGDLERNLCRRYSMYDVGINNARVRAIQKDAERYRYVRQCPSVMYEDFEQIPLSEEEIDNAVDVAIGE